MKNSQIPTILGVSLLILFFLLLSQQNRPTSSDSTPIDVDTLALATEEKTPLPEEKEPVGPVVDQQLTEMGRFLAGMSPVNTSADLDSIKSINAWTKHQDFFNQTWANLEANQMNKILPWADKNLPTVRSLSDLIFYPFSGPDFLYVHSFFPKGKTYIMAGLEPVGEIPVAKELVDKDLNYSLNGLQVSLDDILNLSFFKTNDMQNDFKRTHLKGIIPVLMVFLSRSGHEIIETNHISVDSTGNLLNYGATRPEDATGIPGVSIKFVDVGASLVQEVQYFSVNLGDFEYDMRPEFTTHVLSYGSPITYLKSASYLLHKDYFSICRNLILDKSLAVLEDDSGIPVKYFPKSEWERTFYGTYTTPIRLFNNLHQADLLALYQDSSNVKPINFGIGYRYQVNTSNMLLAVKKPKTETANDIEKDTPEKGLPSPKIKGQ